MSVAMDLSAHRYLHYVGSVECLSRSIAFPSPLILFPSVRKQVGERLGVLVSPESDNVSQILARSSGANRLTSHA